jgi:hypothetical protein
MAAYAFKLPESKVDSERFNLSIVCTFNMGRQPSVTGNDCLLIARMVIEDVWQNSDAIK